MLRSQVRAVSEVPKTTPGREKFLRRKPSSPKRALRPSSPKQSNNSQPKMFGGKSKNKNREMTDYGDPQPTSGESGARGKQNKKKGNRLDDDDYVDPGPDFSAQYNNYGSGGGGSNYDGGYGGGGMQGFGSEPQSEEKKKKGFFSRGGKKEDKNMGSSFSSNPAVPSVVGYGAGQRPPMPRVGAGVTGVYNQAQADMVHSQTLHQQRGAQRALPEMGRVDPSSAQEQESRRDSAAAARAEADRQEQ